jgi:hypothetical protein
MKMTEFDPYEHLMKITELLNKVTDAHNQLAKDYEKQIKRVNLLEARLDEIKRQHFMDRPKRSNK